MLHGYMGRTVMRQVGFLRPKLESRGENAILVVAASAPVARVAGAQCCGQGPHDQALVGAACPAIPAKVEVLACWHSAVAQCAMAGQVGLAFMYSPSRMTTRERAAGKASWFRPNLILQSDTVCRFSSRFVMIQADRQHPKALIINVGMTCEDSCKI